MKKNVLIISNTNLFTVLSSRFISDSFNCSIFNLRTEYEKFDHQEHMIHQFREHLLHSEYSERYDKIKFNFNFNEIFLYRLNNFLKDFKPDVFLIELKTFNDNEYRLISYLFEKFKLPIIVFSPVTEPSQDVMFNLAEVGVREILTKYNEKNFLNSVNRNI